MSYKFFFIYYFYKIQIEDLILDVYCNFAQLNFVPTYLYLILGNTQFSFTYMYIDVCVCVYIYIYMAPGEYLTF